MSTKPQNILSYLPAWLSHWLGYRAARPPTLPAPQGQPKQVFPTPPSQPMVWFWSWIGGFCGVAVIQAVFGQVSYFVERGVTPIVPSYGATAVLVYGVIDSPLAQPRNVLFGHFFGGLVGVCVAKLFGLLPTEERYNDLAWLAASIACATAIVLMQVTKTVHPPAGATAFIPVLDPSQRRLGWYFLPVLLLSSVLAVAVGLVTNNIQRRYPVYWISPPVPVVPAAQPPPEASANFASAGASSGGSLSEKNLVGVSVSGASGPGSGAGTVVETARTSKDSEHVKGV